MHGLNSTFSATDNVVVCFRVFLFCFFCFVLLLLFSTKKYNVLILFSKFSIKTYIVLLIRSALCFHGDIRKIFGQFT